jgi:hypothetical protein
MAPQEPDLAQVPLDGGPVHRWFPVGQRNVLQLQWVLELSLAPALAAKHTPCSLVCSAHLPTLGSGHCCFLLSGRWGPHPCVWQ